MAARDYSETIERNIVCPRCDATTFLTLTPGRAPYVCTACACSFTVLAARVRASRSRADRAAGRRDYAVRIVCGSDEDLYEFAGPLAEFDLKSGDEVAFVEHRERICLVYNFSLRRYMRLRKPRELRWKPAVAVLAALAILAVLLLRHR